MRAVCEAGEDPPVEYGILGDLFSLVLAWAKVGFLLKALQHFFFIQQPWLYKGRHHSYVWNSGTIWHSTRRLLKEIRFMPDFIETNVTFWHLFYCPIKSMHAESRWKFYPIYPLHFTKIITSSHATRTQNNRGHSPRRKTLNDTQTNQPRMTSLLSETFRGPVVCWYSAMLKGLSPLRLSLSLEFNSELED